ncbi:MAG: hypothetical protein A3B25_01585 [Candidatus Ryanbacteria bacterium RIFCSPLOWO2_01_FULL_48_26]|uniref:Schlafen AlbA-2 domain-containing protein n=1 Tax=Candidatus Ryanbacteria bacterium RIFCSPLOWO2_01_FULL_48_26 TaxID=1802126 RepID=A0A1G2GXM6_9BACT|nr:MAG: hypothetical protein A3B25_01585 [Candidatus Ryanbacteria bacterium RIFCSPLOWO2_01_FULL_48_26]OHB20699.1 MAG: hypothetical protein A3J67_05775 [Parcubacteria group bacterium RIFCSPHIGHO2_02_FULL_48_10b]
MNDSVTVKRSPIVLIRTFIAIEALAFVAYLVAAALGNSKYEFYTQLSLSNLLSYQAAKFLFLSGAQLIITIYAFLRWYYEHYTIEPGALSHEWGVFFKRRKTVPLEKSMSLMLASGPLGKFLHYGTIRVQSSASSNVLVLADISYPENNLKTIHTCIDLPPLEPREQPDISKLISQGEHERLEFKSSLRFDHHSRQVNRELEKATLKTIAAFLNSKGGNIVIGVNDTGEPLGLENDYQTLGRRNSDGFENHFTQLFNKTLGPEFRHLAKLWFHTIQNHDVCVINVAPSARPAYLKFDDTEHFYVRTGNVTTPLKLSEVESYARSHWPRWS